MKTYHFIIRGRVQGVGFRYFVKKRANELGIKGSVKNLINGDVEVYAQANKDTIMIFKEFLNKGPVLSRVDNIIEDIFDMEKFDDFLVLFWFILFKFSFII